MSKKLQRSTRQVQPGDRSPPGAMCRAVRLLAEGKSAADVAQALATTPQTIRAWQAGEDFQVLLAALVENTRLRRALDGLSELTPDAIAAYRRALAEADSAAALRAARDVLDRVLPLAQSSEQVIRVEYVNRDSQPYSATLRARIGAAQSGTLQGGGVRAALGQDGDGPADDQ